MYQTTGYSLTLVKKNSQLVTIKAKHDKNHVF
jgi:hypothetical protein